MDTIRRMKRGSDRVQSVMVVATAAVAIAVVSTIAWQFPQKTVTPLPATPVDEGLVAITNKISSSFDSNIQRWWCYEACIARTGRLVGSETNQVRRQVIARHLMHEFCSFEFSGEDLKSWEMFVGNYDKLLCGVLNVIGNDLIDEMERWKFTFDAIQHYKDECIATLDEPKIAPDESERRPFGGWGVSKAQKQRKRYTMSLLSSMPHAFDLEFFQLGYTKLSSEMKKYFRKRFREVFGIDYIPYSTANRRLLWGIMGTRWQGEGLEWRVLVGDKDKVLDPKEYWEKSKED